MTDRSEASRVDYGNWVSNRIIFSMFSLFLIFGLLSALEILVHIVSGGDVIGLILLILSVVFLCFTVYFIYARYLFSSQGHGIQDMILETLMDKIDWDGNGNVLDVGCGSGALAVKIAKRFKNARVAGIDYWGKMWEYTKKRCEDNAEIEGVGGRLSFSQASASSLPFDDRSFDLVVSNLVFHEVSDMKDKRDLVKEALRVVKKGGIFVFQDLFLIERFYGSVEDFLEIIKNWGIAEVKFENTSKSEFIPKVLKLPFMVGTIGMIYGKK